MFSITAVLWFSLPFLLELLCPCQSHSTFCSVTQALLEGQQATILTCVEECYSFDMAPINWQLIKKPEL